MSSSRRISSSSRLRLSSLALLGSLLIGLGPSCSDDDDETFGPPTNSICPEISTLTYGTFGQEFMTKYCTSCHSSELKGDARQGAPEYHDYDTISGIRAVGDLIDQTTASGPAATNLWMPPGRPVPTQEEREKLGEWLSCGAP